MASLRRWAEGFHHAAANRDYHLDPVTARTTTTLLDVAAREIERLRAERDKLIDGNISASGPMASKLRYTAFPDQSNEEWFDTMAEARAHVRSCFGLEVES